MIVIFFCRYSFKFLALCCLLFYSQVNADTNIQTAANYNDLHEQIVKARNNGQIERAETLAKQFLATAQKNNSITNIAKAYFQLARNAMEINDYPLAQRHLNNAITQFGSLDDQESLGRAYRQLGLTYRYQARYPTALEYIYQALQIAQQQENIDDIGSAYNSIGVVLEKMGLFEEAIQAHQNALEIDLQLGDNSGIAGALYNLGAIRMTMGDYEDALRYHYDALAMDIAAGTPKDIAYSHNKIGYLLAVTGEYEQSREHLTKALSLFQQIKTPRDTDWALSSLAKLELEEGNYVKASELIDGVILRATENGYKSLLVDALQVAAEIAIKEADYPKALGYIERGVAQAEEINERDQASYFEELKVNVYVATDSLQEAFKALQRQKKIDDEIFRIKRADSIAKVQAQTEFVRRGHQIDLLKKEQALQHAKAEQQHAHRDFLLISVIATAVVLFLTHKRLMQKRLNKHLSHQVKLRTKELEVKHAELQQAYREIEAISLTDKLTGLNNRRFLENHVDKDMEQCLRVYQNWWQGKGAKPNQEDIAFFVIDLDDFKQVNDNFGHQAGDNVLMQLTERMGRVFRHADYLVRWGGEEFVAVARHIDRNDAAILASRMQRAVYEEPFDLFEGKQQRQTCSIGFACYPPMDNEDCLAGNKRENGDWHVMIALADACLYQVKSAGKNSWMGVNAVNNRATFSQPVSLTRLQQLIELNYISVIKPDNLKLNTQKSEIHQSDISH